MRLLAIGDIHGCATALDALVQAIQLQPGDRLITLGDYFNKGEDSNAVLERLINLYRQGALIPIKGNHELKLLRAIELGITDENKTVLVDASTLNSYRRLHRPGTLLDIPKSHLHFIQSCCLNWYETATHLFVHATVEPHLPLHQQSHGALFWDKLINPHPHQSGKILICGHTPQRTGRPLNLGHVICLDTAAAEGQWLTCLDVGTGEVWQANQHGEIRQFWIQDCQPKNLAGQTLDRAMVTNALLS